MSQQKFIVELEGYESDVSALYVATRADDMPGPGRKMYCVGTLTDRGVIELIDCGYNSLEELKLAWPNFVTPATVLTGLDNRA
jgi:hypothetical protein